MALVGLMALAACDNGDWGPLAQGPAVAGGGRGGLASGVVGTWQNVLVLDVPPDFTRTTTTWRFSAGGNCQRTTETFSVIEGVPRTTVRDCTYSVDAAGLLVTYAGGTAPVRVAAQFAGFAPDRLVLDGFEFLRIG